MIEVQILLNVRPDKMDDVLSLLYEDKRNSVSNSVFSEFNIKNKTNKIEIKARCESMDILNQHMIETHYRWKELKDNGHIISQSHRFISI
jgi:PIN domain nuclease of toxin-antitoxin system